MWNTFFSCSSLHVHTFRMLTRCVPGLTDHPGLYRRPIASIPDRFPPYARWERLVLVCACAGLLRLRNYVCPSIPDGGTRDQSLGELSFNDVDALALVRDLSPSLQPANPSMDAEPSRKGKPHASRARPSSGLRQGPRRRALTCPVPRSNMLRLSFGPEGKAVKSRSMVVLPFISMVTEKVKHLQRVVAPYNRGRPKRHRIKARHTGTGGELGGGWLVRRPEQDTARVMDGS